MASVKPNPHQNLHKVFRISSDAETLAALRRHSGGAPATRQRRGSPVTMAPLVRAESRARLSRLVATSAEVVHRVKDQRLAKTLPKCVCVPNSRLSRCWDMYTLAALVYVAVVTPFQMAFLFDNSLNDISSWMGLFVLDRVVDLTFLVDIIVSFRTGWIVHHDNGTVEYRFSCKEGSRRYVKSWFVVDVISILPVEVLDVIPAVELGAWSRISKVFKLFRFAKLMRILRATRIFSRWEKELVLRMPYGAIRLIKFVIVFFAVVHWLGCIFYFIQVLAKVSGVQATWEDQSLTAAEADSIWASYLASVYWSLATVTTVGYGDVKPVATAERILAVCGMIIGTTMFAFVIGTMINLVEGFMVRKTSFQNYMDVLSSFSARVGIPRHLLKRLHNFGFEMEERFDIPYDRRAQNKALDMLSPFLRANVLNHIHRRALNQTELLVLADNEEKKRTLVHAMASHLQRRTHGQYEVVVEQGHKARCLYILMDGNLNAQRIDIRRQSWNVETKLLYPPADFGTEALLFPNGNVKWDHTYKTESSMCEFLVLTAARFGRVLLEAPDALDCVATLRRIVTLRRAKRCLQHPGAPQQILTLLREFKEHTELERKLFDEASDELLREIIQRKTGYLKQLEEAARTDMESNMVGVSGEVAERLQKLKNEMLSISVTSLLKKKKKKHKKKKRRDKSPHKKRHGDGSQVARAAGGARPLHTPHAGAGGGGFAAGPPPTNRSGAVSDSSETSGVSSSGSTSGAGGAHHHQASSGSVGYFDAEDARGALQLDTAAARAGGGRGAPSANRLYTPTSRDPLDC